MDRDPAPFEERFRRLLGVSKVLGAIRDPEELIRALGRELQRILAFDHLGLFLADLLREGVSWHVLRTEDQAVFAPAGVVPLERTAEAWVFEHQRPVAFPATDGRLPVPGM
ncbi:hypothetical protein FBQ97_18050, partial [Acidobacteria bacterium ACD]|nr:hypothetical protein [Acidobacteria bacterium ACD]